MILRLPTLFLFLLICGGVLHQVTPFLPRDSVPLFSFRLTAKRQGSGFGAKGEGFGGAKAKPDKKPSKQSIAKALEKKYGGTSAEDIARGTQKEIDQSMQQLPEHVRIAAQLYQQLNKWNSYVQSLTLLQQASLPKQEAEGANRAQSELERIYREYNLTEMDLHNTFQKITWDASADAKAARALIGKMPFEISERIDRACKIIAEAVGESGRCLDVGCGFGVLVPALTQAGVKKSQIYGVDLSPEMIRNAEIQHPGVSFTAADFLAEYTVDLAFEAVVFCSSLHDMPDSVQALRKAASLLLPGGKLVIVHAQGASHVLSQHRSNPIMVKGGLPDAKELEDLDPELLSLVVTPAAINSPQERQEGYLAVLQRR